MFTYKNKMLNKKTIRSSKTVIVVLFLMSSAFFIGIQVIEADYGFLPPKTIWGYVKYDNGNAVIGATVVVSANGYPKETDTTDSFGAYQVDVGPDGGGIEWPTGTFFTVTVTKNYWSSSNSSIILGINTRCDIIMITSEPESDLNCNGEITKSNLKPGNYRLNGEFYIENIGVSNSNLNWYVADYPDFGSSWICSPSNGYNIKPDDGLLKVDVSFNITGGKNEDFSGSILIANSNNPTDYDTIPLVVSFQKNKYINQFFINFQQYPILLKILKRFFKI